MKRELPERYEIPGVRSLPVRDQGELGATSAIALANALALEALMSGVDVTVTDNGDGTYTHTLRAEEHS